MTTYDGADDVADGAAEDDVDPARIVVDDGDGDRAAMMINAETRGTDSEVDAHVDVDDHDDVDNACGNDDFSVTKTTRVKPASTRVSVTSVMSTVGEPMHSNGRKATLELAGRRGFGTGHRTAVVSYGVAVMHATAAVVPHRLKYTNSAHWHVR